MKQIMSKQTIISSLILLMGLTINLPAQSTISSDIHISAGETVKRSVSTVSGDVIIGKKVKVLSSVSSVSGDIEIGAKAKVGDVTAVSGDISIGKGASTDDIETVSGDIHLYGQNDIHGSVETVSGDVNCKAGSDIQENLSTVSGDIELDDVTLRSDLETVSGDISLFNGAVIEGDIIINRRFNPAFPIQGKLKVIIDLNSVVMGSIIVKEPNTNVFVYLSNGGKVRGDIVNAEVRNK